MIRTIRPLAFLGVAALLVAGRGEPARGATAVVFGAPSGHAVTGPTAPSAPFDRVLPSGRFVHPTGTSVVVGMGAEGVALTPSGRFAVVSNDARGETTAASAIDPATMGGSSLAIVDTESMTVVARYADPNESFFAGVVAVPDPLDAANTLVFASGGERNVVYAFDLDATGALKPDATHAVAIPGSSDARLVFAGRSYPSTLVAARGGRFIDVVDTYGDDVAQIDVATRALSGAPVPVGFAPFGAATGPNGLFVANEGLLAYLITPPAQAPPFATAPVDLARASSLSIVPQAADGTLATAAATSLPLDRTPDGVREVGGAQPSAVAAMRKRPYAFVAMSNVDRIATIALDGGVPRVAGGTELRLYDRGPYGTQPLALVLAPSERRLYVALAGIDAIAVLDSSDPRRLHRVGLIPTGWYPAALALSRDGRYLFVANAKGLDHDRGFTGDGAASFDAAQRVTTVRQDAGAQWSTLERIDLAHVDLRRSTPRALSDLRSIAPAKHNRLVPQRFAGSGSAFVKHVVFVQVQGRSYDAMLGDLVDGANVPYAGSDPDYVAFGAAVTPNLHALARTFGVAANLYADAALPGLGQQFSLGGVASQYAERMATVATERDDPEGYPRAGYIFNALAARGKTYRDYGGLLRVTGYEPDAGTVADLGGTYASSLPAPLALSGHVDLAYPGWNPRVTNARRADEFVRDFDTYVKAGTMPAFTYVWLPPTQSSATVAPETDEAADADRALGTIVAYLTHLPQWSSTAIFITPTDSLASRDHVDPGRTYAIVVSPYAKRHYAGMRHLSTASVLKTEEELLGLPALSLGDALASDLADFFTTAYDPEPFVAAPPP